MTIDKKSSSLLDTVRTLVEVFSYMLTDLELMKSGTVFYNIDFSILFPYIWPNSTDSIPDYIPSGKRIFGMLSRINKFDVGFKLVFTGASFWELIDAANHQNERWRMRRQSKTLNINYEDLAKKIEGPVVSFDSAKSMLIENGIALHELELLTQRGFEKQVTEPLNKVKSLFKDNSALIGLGNAISATNTIEEGYKKRYESILKEMLWKRRDRNPRPEPDRRFHYKVDSANAAYSMVNNSSNKQKVYFTTPMGYIRDKYLKDKLTKIDNGRSPLVPYYFISANFLKEEKQWFTKLEDYLEDGLKLSHQVIAILERESDFSKMTQMQRKKIINIIEDFIVPLKKPTGTENIVDAISTKEDIVKALKNARDLSEKYQSAETILREETPILAKFADKLLEDELISTIDLDKDEIVLRLKKKIMRK